MKIKRLFVSAAIVLFLICVVTGVCVEAQDDNIYYVSEKGSDSNDGKTVETAFKTLKTAVKAIGKNDGTVKIIDTVYWSFDAKRSNVPAHTGTITFEGANSDKIDSQIIDYSEMCEDTEDAADLLISGPTVFKNITLKGHFNKAVFTNSHSLTLSEKIKYINDDATNSDFVIYLGNPSAHSTGDSLTVDADVSVSSINLGYSFAYKLMGKTSLKILRGNIGTVSICNKRAQHADVDIKIYNGNIGSFSMFKGGKITDKLTMLVNTSVCPALSDYSGMPENSLVVCSDNGNILDVSQDNALSVLSQKTAVISKIGQDDVLYSPFGGSIILDNGIYDVVTEDKAYYTNDGKLITVFEPVKIDFDRMYYQNRGVDGYIGCGWSYKGEKEGPSNNSLLPSGTVLEAKVSRYDPSGDEFGIIGGSIRLEGGQALRFVTEKKNSFDKKFDIVEYGTLVAPSSDYEADALYIDTDCARVKAQNTLKTTDDGMLYTACLTGISESLYGEIYSARSYAVCKDANGKSFTVYSDIYSTSLGRLARFAGQNQNKEKFDKIISQWQGEVMKNIKQEKNEIYETAYSAGEAGTHVRELKIDSGRKDGKVTEIALITDTHLQPNEKFIKAADNVMKIAKLSDTIVLCGDNVESVRHLPLLQEHILDLDKSIMCVVGNHELLNEMSADAVANRKLTDAALPHDTRYYSRLIHNRVLAVTMDDCTYTFTKEQCDKLEQDIALARANNYPVLLFYHAKIVDTKIGENDRMYNIIKSNADVIKAVFNGHYHVDDKYTIPGSYTDKNGKTVERDVPCYLLRGNAEDGEDGNLLKIIVE